MLHLPSFAVALSLGGFASAQVTMTATTFGSGVSVDGINVVPSGVDVLAGFSHIASNSCGTFNSSSMLTVTQSEQSLRGDLYASAQSPFWTCPGSAAAMVEFVITSSVPTILDVSLEILSEGSSTCGGFPMGSYSGSSQLLGFGPLTNEHCEAGPFLPPCRYTFASLPIDANGLTIQLSVSAGVGSAGICPFQSAGVGVAFEVEPAACAQEYGTACGTDLSAITKLSTPGQYDVTVSDPGAQLGALMIGADQIALPLLGCTLLTTPLVSIPLPLDQNGEVTFQSGLPVLPFSLQAVTVENLIIHFSQGLLGCQ